MEYGFQKAKEAEQKMGRTVADCPFRTRYHIQPPVGWLNDPNGLCQFKGLYHAYFQYSPLNVHGGGGYWGHCVSSDLLRWEYKEPVLTADIPEDRNGVYSGSALVEDGRMYIFYTGNVKLPGDHDYIDEGRISTQILTESEDGQSMSPKIPLLRMEDYPKYITQHIRDPKVWKENGIYYMVLGARVRAWDEQGIRKDKGAALIYRSDDKLHWELDKELIPDGWFGYMWECPDIFYMDREKILSFCPQGLASSEGKYQNIYQSGYSILTEKEDPEDTFREWDMGFDFYAPQTFEDNDGRRIIIGWAGLPDTENCHRNLSVQNGWQHCLSLPAELTFQNGKIYRYPVRELENLQWNNKKIDTSGIFNWSNCTVRLEITEIGGKKENIRIGTDENYLLIHIEGNKTELSFLDDENNPAKCGGGREKREGRTDDKTDKVLILIDSSIVEVYVNDGEIVFTTRIYLEPEERNLKISGEGDADLKVIEK